MVNITDIYERVLVVLNKENRGYVTRDEFNSLAKQAQLEIFESYFTKKALSVQGENDTDYSNPVMNVEEKITFFDNVMTIPRGTTRVLPYPMMMYRLGVVDIAGRQIDEVSHKDLLYINLSPLTSPTITQPVYVRHEGGIVIYPLDYEGDVTVNYLRTPMAPNFSGTVVGQQVLPGMNDVNFELHPSEEIELTNKILTYMGVVTRDGEVVQFASGKESQIQNSEQ